MALVRRTIPASAAVACSGNNCRVPTLSANCATGSALVAPGRSIVWGAAYGFKRGEVFRSSRGALGVRALADPVAAAVVRLASQVVEPESITSERFAVKEFARMNVCQKRSCGVEQ